MPFATWMDLEMIIEVSQKDKDTYHLISTFMWNLKQDSNELTYKTGTDSDMENRLMVVKGRDDLRVWDQQMQTSIYKMD